MNGLKSLPQYYEEKKPLLDIQIESFASWYNSGEVIR